MDNKTLALVSYITIIGWAISFISYNKQAKNSLVSYHLKQSFGLFLVYLVYWFLAVIAVTILAIVFSFSLAKIVDKISYLGYLVFFALIIIGIINASKEEEKPLPIIGQVFEDRFNFV